ncbi:MAG TPA: GAF and ANTAR domain-containing protein [Nocardioidaceae bacterium]|nr:GAF and ANTAR domain-containing protein [Nocardioidaceae bacterium]
MTSDDTRVERAAGGDPGRVFRGLAGLVYAGDDYGEMHQAICDAALHLIEGCDHASIMIARDGKLVTAAASDDIARHVDDLEREVGEGACVDAIHDEAAQLDPDLTSASAWPRLRERVVDETPVRGMAGFRLLLGDQKIGSLNVFSDRPHALTESSVDQAAVLAAFASVALVAAANHQQARTLREGLESNREIGKAVGLMMAFHKVTDEEAFAILRRASQDMNVKLAEVAHQVVDHHNQRPKPGLSGS